MLPLAELVAPPVLSVAFRSELTLPNFWLNLSKFSVPLVTPAPVLSVAVSSVFFSVGNAFSTSASASISLLPSAFAFAYASFVSGMASIASFNASASLLPDMMALRYASFNAGTFMMACVASSEATTTALLSAVYTISCLPSANLSANA